MRPADTSRRPEHQRGDGFGTAVKRVVRLCTSNAPTIQWQFFLGACLLAGAALLPHAPVRPVLAGMVLAGVVHYAWLKIVARGKDDT